MNNLPEKELLHLIALGMVHGIGAVRAKKLVEACGSAAAVFSDPRGATDLAGGMGASLAAGIERFSDFARAKAELAFAQRHGIRICSCMDEDYPPRLRQCEDAPPLLYIKGEADLNADRMVAVVGARHMSAYGRKKCGGIIEGLARHGAVVVSGLAHGVDACAHRAALENGLTTVAVLGHGLDRLYPAQNAELARRILRQGALVTEFPSGTVPDRENFPRRNRIIAGLCDAVVVIEAAITGGALITAEIANSYNRDVFALPGRTTDPYSMGCNKLIKSHKANLIESAEDLEFVLGWDPLPHLNPSRQASLFPPLTPDEQRLAELLRARQQADTDLLSDETGLPAGRISSLLLTLELKGLVVSLPGRLYALKDGA